MLNTATFSMRFRETGHVGFLPFSGLLLIASVREFG